MHIRENMKQFKIDNGEIGGAIQIFASSLVILQPFSFIGILALNYDRYIKWWIDINTFIIVSFIGLVVYEWMFFAFIFPSMMRFNSRQVCAHDNPIYNEMQDMKLVLKKIEDKLDKL